LALSWRRWKAGCVILVLSLSLAAPVVAGPLEDATAAYTRRDFATALRLLRPLADQGDAFAQSLLGFMYANGRGAPQDYAEAVTWYRKAADQGRADAQFNLALMYANGQGVPQDHAEAMTWYRKAAEQGDAAAQLNLGVIYHVGQGVPQDYVQAHKWYNLAAARFPASDSEKRANAVRNRDAVTAKMTAAQIAEAQRLAREWKPK
jgi:TPR repeat protein